MRAEAASGTTVFLPTLGSVYVCEELFCVRIRMQACQLLTQPIEFDYNIM